MVKFSEDRYLMRGWSEEDIKKTKEILKREKSKKNTFEDVIYWLVLFVVIVGNFAFALLLIPLMIAGDTFVLYSMVLIAGILFGTVFALILNELDRSSSDKTFSLFFVPISAFFIFFTVSNLFAENFDFIKNRGIFPALAYVISFLIPQTVNYLNSES